MFSTILAIRHSWQKQLNKKRSEVEGRGMITSDNEESDDSHDNKESGENTTMKFSSDNSAASRLSSDTSTHITNIIKSVSKITAPAINLNEESTMNPIRKKEASQPFQRTTSSPEAHKWKLRFAFSIKKHHENQCQDKDQRHSQQTGKPQVSTEDIRQAIANDHSNRLIVLVDQHSFWMEAGTPSYSQIHRQIADGSSSLLNIDQAAKVYRKTFIGQEHWNFIGTDKDNRHYVLSFIRVLDDIQDLKYRAVLRTPLKMIHGIIDSLRYPQPISVFDIFRATLPSVQIEKYIQLIDEKIYDELAIYDEQSITRNFKFGILYQKSGQVTEEEMYNNEEMSPFFKRFLDVIAQKISLNGYGGYNGELDTKYDLTGESSYASNFEGNQIMFHVATLLPFNPNDPQQIEKKRHIGNDIVAIVLQEHGAKFCPSVIGSHFLQVFVCLQRQSEDDNDNMIKVEVAATPEVSKFGPYMEASYSYEDPTFRQLLYRKDSRYQRIHDTKNFTGKIGMLLRKRREMLFDHMINKLIDTTRKESPIEDKKDVSCCSELEGKPVLQERKLRKRAYTSPGLSNN
ncbi:hypothetical protein ACOME3_003674 [Neoechinorhynchus agilis]